MARIKANSFGQFDVFTKIHFTGRLVSLWGTKALNHHPCGR